MANNLTWAIAAIVFPISLSCLGLAAEYPAHKIKLAIGSNILVLFWVFASVYYGVLATNLRKAMMKIEEEVWNLEDDKGFYLTQKLVGYKPSMSG